MKLINRHLSTNRFVSLAAAVIIPLATGFSGIASAADCAPLQISNYKILGANPIREGGTVVGVQFRVQTTITNTNRYRGHIGRPMDMASSTIFVARHRRSLGDQHLGQHDIPTGLAGGASKVYVSDVVNVMRDPGNLSQFVAHLHGYVHNSDCGPGRPMSKSDFKFDLNPLLQNKNARRISARIRGYSERARPRPRNDRPSAPRPRT